MRTDSHRATIRPRLDEDLAACVLLARRLRETDGYPAFLPGDDFSTFLSPSNSLGAFVAVRGDEVVGHVAIRTSSAPSATVLATSRLGVDASRLGFVARLMVDPGARRLGIASALLASAVEALRERGLVVVLDVLTKDAAAIALYEREGWSRLGETSFTSRTGVTYEEIVFVAPGEAGVGGV